MAASPESRGTNSVAMYVYLMASIKDGTLYFGVTNDLIRRAYQHRTKSMPSFTSRYDVRRFVWFETYDDAVTAITREKEIKSGDVPGKFV